MAAYWRVEMRNTAPKFIHRLTTMDEVAPEMQDPRRSGRGVEELGHLLDGGVMTEEGAALSAAILHCNTADDYRLDGTNRFDH
ncbi:hypothetical protein AS189_15825 [Arthrobacter alpinus]|uniref:Uncharacterized protein n=1 Tax=Arthrobacter alpinus TaxID=656366 RepID=A0A0S2M234_9MICC|nr:hypothetical protein AS189_15765 [Arthrobacter alpinus]ALO67681.1 hypothetical protein AS189_15825 [Arthrobacter alpinus]